MDTQQQIYELSRSRTSRYVEEELRGYTRSEIGRSVKTANIF
jgi:hypothetical protein